MSFPCLCIRKKDIHQNLVIVNRFVGKSGRLGVFCTDRRLYQENHQNHQQGSCCSHPIISCLSARIILAHPS